MLLIRLLAVLVVFPAVYFFVYWVPGNLYLRSLQCGFLPMVVSLTCAVAASWFTWNKLGNRQIQMGPLSSVCLGAIVMGAIGFCAGFFGPIIFMPGANQGPLLGIFITGPLGFIVGGGIGGILYWRSRRRGNSV